MLTGAVVECHRRPVQEVLVSIQICFLREFVLSYYLSEQFPLCFHN